MADLSYEQTPYRLLQHAIHRRFGTPKERAATAKDVLIGLSPEGAVKFEDAISWLPLACLLSSRQGERYREIANEIIAFLKVFRNELSAFALWHVVQDVPCWILQCWTKHLPPQLVRTYFPPRSIYVTSCSVDDPDIDEFLNMMYEARIAVDGHPLFDYTFTSWSSDPQNSAHALHVLGFLYRVRYRPSELPIFRCENVLTAAFELAKWRSLWRSSAEFARAVLPEDLCSELDVAAS